MTKVKKRRDHLIAWLDNLMEFETSKPINEVDIEFVNECESVINILMEDYCEYTDEEAEKFLSEIKARKKAKIHRFLVKSKKRIVALIIACVVFLGGIGFGAFNPACKSIMLEVLNLEIGETIEKNSFTFTRCGVVTKYESLEDFRNSEKLDILLPTVLPEDITLKEVRINELGEVGIYFSDSTINFRIESFDRDVQLRGEEYNFGEYSFYIYEHNEKFHAHGIIQGKMYNLNSYSKESLITIISNLK